MNNSRITRASVDRSGNRYCGPLVLAALLGCSTAEAAAKVREAADTDRAIKGMLNHEMIKTLAANGFNVAKLDVPKRYIVRRRIGETVANAVQYCSNTWTLYRGPNNIRTWRPPDDHSYGGSAMTPLKLTGCTLAQWLRQRPERSGTYVINVTGHYVLVVGRKFVDTGTRGEWVPLAKAPHRRTRVENVWQVSR